MSIAVDDVFVKTTGSDEEYVVIREINNPEPLDLKVLYLHFKHSTVEIEVDEREFDSDVINEDFTASTKSAIDGDWNEFYNQEID